MKPYLAMLGARFRMLLQYRAAALAGLGTQLFWGYTMVAVYEALYASTNVPQPMSLAQVVTYIWLGQALFAMLPWSADQDVALLVRTGGVAYEMLRPVDLYWMWYSRALARRLAPTLMRAVPMFALAFLFLGLEPPASSVAALGWIVATIGAACLASAITALMGISLLWTISGDGLNQLAGAMVVLLSGMLIPLPLMPDWAERLVSLLPFRGVVDTPFRIYTGHINGYDILTALAHQWLWAFVIVCLGRWALAIGLKRLVVQGG